jgi:CheY-like chemotaxis protein
VRLLAPQDAARAALKVAGPQLRHVANLVTEYRPTPRVHGEEARLVQALVNLLINAGQAIQRREGASRITLRTGMGPGGEALVEVEDDGPGVPMEHVARLAEPYFTTRAPEGGQGLGLFVTRGIVDGHGGRLEFLPAAGGGTRARILLPAAGGPMDAPEASAATPHVAPPEASAGERRARLLVVDDDPLVLDVLVGLLEREWDVEGAASGAEALERLRRGGWDAVLCDLMMPGISGIRLADEVSRMDPALRARMVFLTGGAVTPEAQAFVARPDVRHLMKPVDSEQLLRLMRETATA